MSEIGDASLQRIAGAAAVLWAVGAIAMQLALFFLYIPSLGYSADDLNDPARTARILTAGHLVFLWEAVALAAAGAFLFVLVRALYLRLRPAYPELSFSAAVYGYAALAFLLIEQLRVVAYTNVLGTTFSQQQADQFHPVFDALHELFNGAFLLLVAVWILIASLASLRGRVLTRPLAYFGLLASVPILLAGTGTIQVSAGALLVQIWFLWVGLLLLLRPVVQARSLPSRG